MGITLTEARATLMDSVLHAESGTFDTDKQDRALKVAFERFLRETHITRTVASIAVTSGSYTFDATATATDFLPGCLTEAPYILSENRQLQVVSFTNLIQRRRTSGSGSSGIPELVAWQSPTLGYLFPTLSANYTIALPYYQPLVSWTPGTATPASVTINCPERYAYEVIWWGARASLVYGAPGHPDDQAAAQQFDALIQRARCEVTQTGVWFLDQNSNYGMSYTYRGQI